MGGSTPVSSVTGRRAGALEPGLPGLSEADLLALDRALERRPLAEVAVLETDRDGAQQVGARRGWLVLERLEEEIGERAVRAATERRVRGGLPGLARREQHGLRRGRPALGQLDEGPAVGTAGRGEGPQRPRLLQALARRRRQEPRLPTEELCLHDLLEVLQSGPAVARVEQHLEQDAGRNAGQEVVQLVVDDDGVAVPLVALLADVVTGEGLVEVVGLEVAAGLVGHLGAVAREREDDVVTRLRGVDALRQGRHDRTLARGGVGEHRRGPPGEADLPQGRGDVVGVVDSAGEPARLRQRLELVDPHAQSPACHGLSFLLENPSGEWVRLGRMPFHTVSRTASGLAYTT